MRYKFWVDSIEQIYNSGRHRFHPTLMEMSFGVETFKLDKLYFEQMIDARRRLLRRDGFNDVAEYVETLGNVHVGMNSLMVQILQADVDQRTKQFLQSFSKTQG